MKTKKILSIILCMCILLSVIIAVPVSVSAAGKSFEEASAYSIDPYDVWSSKYLTHEVYDTLDGKYDADYYFFDVKEPKTLWIKVDGELNLFIYDSINKVKPIWTKYAPENSAYIREYVNLLPGKYYFVVKNKTDNKNYYKFEIDSDVVKDSFTVTFNSNGFVIDPAKEKVDFGDTVTPPTVQEDTGWSFGGWYTDSAFTKPYDFSNLVTSDMTLYAKWITIDETQPSTQMSTQPSTQPSARPSMQSETVTEKEANGTSTPKQTPTESHSASPDQKTVKASTNGGSSATSTSPKTGQEDTIVFVMLGVMILASAVIFFVRKRERT